MTDMTENLRRTSIERKPLPPLNYSITLTDADRARVHNAIREKLNDLLNGPSSFYPDGSRRNWRAILNDIDALIAAVEDLPNSLYDPTNISRDAAIDLKKFRREFDQTARDNPVDTPRDNLEIPPQHWPGSGSDNSIINPDRDRTGDAARPNHVNVSESSVDDRMRDLRGLIAGRHSEYWRGPKADALQQEYRDLIEMRGNSERSSPLNDLASEGAAKAEHNDSRSVANRMSELQGLMGDRHSEYWRGPNAEDLQEEYRDLIERRSRNRRRDEDLSVFAKMP